MPIIVERPYTLEPKEYSLRDFHNRRDLFVLRPPYQRKNVWSNAKKEALIDSFFRRHYVPSIVLREVHTPQHQMKWEVVDGQQRIIAIQEFFENKIKLPKSLEDLNSDAGKYYQELDESVKEHIEERSLRATIIAGLTNPEKRKYQKLVTDIFWRLQQGESLRYMEVEHSKLYSGARSFVVKYADDISFDNEKYTSLNENASRHEFFCKLPMDNSRLQHLALLSRFLMLEFANGPTDIGTKRLGAFIDRWIDRDLQEFEETSEAKRCLKVLKVFSDILSFHPSARNDGIVPELEREYFVISVYLLIRRLVHGGWTFKKKDYAAVLAFIQDTYERWRDSDSEDKEVLQFRDQRQQNEMAVRMRDQLISKWFFEKNPEMDKLDPSRRFTYAQRVAIYRKHKGLCQKCLEEGLSDDDAWVPWTEFDADHIRPHSKGGLSTVKNGQVLCARHNRSLGAKH